MAKIPVRPLHRLPILKIYFQPQRPEGSAQPRTSTRVQAAPTLVPPASRGPTVLGAKSELPTAWACSRPNLPMVEFHQFVQIYRLYLSGIRSSRPCSHGHLSEPAVTTQANSSSGIR